MVYVIGLRAGSGRNVLILLASCQQTCMTHIIAVCTVKNSWWWTEELSETCRVLIQKEIWEVSASSWLYYKIDHDARSPGCQKRTYSYHYFSGTQHNIPVSSSRDSCLSWSPVADGFEVIYVFLRPFNIRWILSFYRLLAWLQNVLRYCLAAVNRITHSCDSAVKQARRKETPYHNLKPRQVPLHTPPERPSGAIFAPHMTRLSY